MHFAEGQDDFSGNASLPLAGPDVPPAINSTQVSSAAPTAQPTTMEPTLSLTAGAAMDIAPSNTTDTKTGCPERPQAPCRLEPSNPTVSHRISRIPFAASVGEFDYPDLVGDDPGELSNGEKSPSTPRSIDDSTTIAPATEKTSQDLKALPLLPPPPRKDKDSGSAEQSMTAPIPQAKHGLMVVQRESLGVIQEEPDHARTPTSTSVFPADATERPAASTSGLLGSPAGGRVGNVALSDKKLPPLPPLPPLPQPSLPPIDTSSFAPIQSKTTVAHSISTAKTHSANRSIGSSTTSSDEWRKPKSRLSSLFARLSRSGNALGSSGGTVSGSSSRGDSRASWGNDGFMDKRSLTPIELSVPRDTLAPSDDPESHARRTSIGSGLAEQAEGSGSPALPLPTQLELSLGQGQKEPVFGVSLADSLKVAKIRVRTSHKGRGHGAREYPPSIFVCCQFIHTKGLQNRRVFSSPGNAMNVAQLKRIFSTPPDYGEHFDFSSAEYTVEDAARLILLFLKELPAPLVPKTVVKRWILLARQEGAIEPSAPRVETGLDFWVEALNPLPTANRNLMKHLLNLFALLATVGGTLSDIDTRRLALATSSSFFHPKDPDMSTEGSLQPSLALAFLIRKRAEYASSLHHVSKSKRDSKSFLPSTKEIMQWKGT